MEITNEEGNMFSVKLLFMFGVLYLVGNYLYKNCKRRYRFMVMRRKIRKMNELKMFYVTGLIRKGRG